ncbi:MAG TPA: hypothetical protein V6D17_13295 [Candidatus Obscuribacterales bacterium]
MTADQNQSATLSGDETSIAFKVPVSRAGIRDDVKVIAVHRAWHAAAIHLAHHHLEHYQSYGNGPALNHEELEGLLAEVTSSAGADMDIARHVAHELAMHVLAELIHGGQPVAVLVVMCDAKPDPEHPELLLELLRQR